MTKENIQITRYETVDEDINSIISLHKLISKDSNLNEHLIYFDSNFLLSPCPESPCHTARFPVFHQGFF